MKPIMNCTANNPMSANRDQMGQEWYHHEAKPKERQPTPEKEGDSCIFLCPNCGHEFRVFRGARLGKLSDPEVIKKIKDNFKQLRARGWNPNA